MRKSNLFPILFTVLLTACSLANPFATPTPAIDVPDVNATATQSAEATPTSDEDIAEPLTLIIWLPPEFSPVQSEDSTTTDVLQARLDQFSERHPGVRVLVRTKAATGKGGLYDSLESSATAAPLGLPDLIVFPVQEMQKAVDKGLLYPIAPYLSDASKTDWYDYAQTAMIWKESEYGLPFIGDAMVMGYRPTLMDTPPHDWDAILAGSNVFGFPAANPLSTFTLIQYQAMGGSLTNDAGKLSLNNDILRSIFVFYKSGQERAVLPYWITQYETPQSVWLAYTEGRVQMAIDWHTQISQSPQDGLSAIAPIPTQSGAPFTYGRTWNWALATPDPDRQAVAVELAEFLSEGTFLANWLSGKGYLPTRPSALSSWGNSAEQLIGSQILSAVELLPPPLTQATLGKPLQTAVVSLLKQEITVIKAIEQINLALE